MHSNIQDINHFIIQKNTILRLLKVSGLKKKPETVRDSFTFKIKK